MNRYFDRKYIIRGIILSVVVAIVIKLFVIQVISDEYALSANNNVLRKIIVYPSRGYILDRKGQLLVQNEPVYDLVVIPKDIKGIDTLEFCRLMAISKEEFVRKMKVISAYSKKKASIFEKQISSKRYAMLQEKLFRFQGFYVQNRTVRNYPSPIAAHVLGYVGEVTDALILKYPYYRSGDYIGISGIERSYEENLRGLRGVRNVMVDVFSRDQGSFQNGRFDTTAVAGQDLTLGIDKSLQEYGEKLMQNKVGSIVALEPSTGEILAFISAPTYDPNLLVGQERSINYPVLSKDPLKPLFIRPIMAQYPPGSIFKVVQCLVAQKEGIIDRYSTHNCNGAYYLGGLRVGCRSHPSPVTLPMSLQWSCNAFYCNTFKNFIDADKWGNPENGYLIWYNDVSKFNIGQKTQIDLPNELKGLLPTTSFYDKYYGKGSWKASNIISLAIGQGELGVTPIQMANIAAIVANRGYYYRPHLVKSIAGKLVNKPEYKEKINLGIDTAYFSQVIEGMEAVVQRGTAAASRIPDIIICGKTGTVQNPHGQDHSVFIAFAPKDNPKIAIAVVLENAGGGSAWSAPTASLMIEHYLKGKLERPQYIEQRILDANFLPKNVGVVVKKVPQD